MRKQEQNSGISIGSYGDGAVQDAHTDRLLIESLGKIIAVYYNDTLNSVSFKEGKLLDFDTFNLKLLENSNGKSTIIPRAKCIRIELGGKENVANPRTK